MARVRVDLVTCSYCNGRGEVCRRCACEPCDCECESPRCCMGNGGPDCTREPGPPIACEWCVGTGYEDPGREDRPW